MLDHAPLLERIFSLDLKEQSYRIESIDGHIPDYVQGNYYLNGPAQFINGDFRYRNWLDGDGMVCALRFENGQIHFTNRFVRTTKRVAEEEAGKPLYRMFGTAFKGDRLKRGIGTESPANVSIYKYGDRLLAFGEQSIPFELHPTTLETLDIFTFNGRLNNLSPFSAHPKIDPETGDRIADLLLEMNRSRGTTLVVVTHSVAMARKLGRSLRIEGGQVHPEAAA